MTVVDQQY